TADGAAKVKMTRGRELRVQLFFGGWLQEEICKARSLLREFGVSEGSKWKWIQEGEEE
ncbi:hypothetical protein BT69DRAFT_1275992, partial [Atractiella rhizophila]